MTNLNPILNELNSITASIETLTNYINDLININSKLKSENKELKSKSYTNEELKRLSAKNEELIANGFFPSKRFKEKIKIHKTLCPNKPNRDTLFSTNNGKFTVAPTHIGDFWEWECEWCKQSINEC